MSGITLSTFGDLIRHGFKLAGYCWSCSRHKDIDLAKMPAERRYVGARFRCRVCGGSVSITLSKINTIASNASYYAALDKWRTPQ